MKLYESGTVIEIPCRIAPGAFPTEYFVAIQLDGEKINGFVPAHYISKNGRSSAYIPGTVERVAGSTLTIRMPGSFFTTIGVAKISQHWAENYTRLS